MKGGFYDKLKQKKEEKKEEEKMHGVRMGCVMTHEWKLLELAWAVVGEEGSVCILKWK